MLNRKITVVVVVVVGVAAAAAAAAVVHMAFPVQTTPLVALGGTSSVLFLR